jgi:hypothetical protein
VLNELYTIQFYTFRKLCKRWKFGNNRIIPALLNYFNIPIRHGSDAVKSQWINAYERKQYCANNMRKNVTKVPHPNLGFTKETKQSLKIVSDKLKVTTSFFDPNIMNKAILHANKTRYLNPSCQDIAKRPLTKNENIIFQHFHTRNIECIGNYSVSPYFIDVFLPECNIGIECFHASRIPFDYQRHYYITGKGITIMYIANHVINKITFKQIYSYIETINSLRINPSFNSKDTVIIGTKNMSPFCNNFDKLTIELIKVYGFNSLFVTAATKHNITNI